MPVDELPPATSDGERLSAETVGARTVSVAVRFALPRVAMIVAVDWDETGKVVSVNIVDVLPAGTVIELGTIPLDRLLESETGRPPGPAGPLMVRVPVAEVPPTTMVGFSVRPIRVGGRMVKVAVFAVAP